MDEQAGIEYVQPPSRETVGLDESVWVKWSLYLLMAFPIVDFALRLNHLHPIGLIWDKVVLLILLFAAIRKYIAGARPPRFHWYRYAGWFLLFGLALMFTGMGDPLVAIQGYRIDIYYILYAFLIPLLITPQDVIRLVHVGASVAILIAVHGIYQYIVKTPIPAGFVDVSEHVRTRVFSVLTSPNELGSYMALTTPIVFGLAIYETNRWRKWMYGIGGFLCGMALLFTFTRGAWAALAVSLLITAVLFERRLLLALVVFGAVAYFLPPIHHRIADLFSPVYWLKATQSGGRIARWLTGFDNLSTNPLFGIGLGRYGGAVAADYHLGIYSDNYYAKTMGEMGLVGLALLFSMHLALVRQMFQNALQKHVRTRFLLIGGITGLVAVLVHNSMENVFEYAPMAIAYFMYATLFLVLGQKVQQEATHD